MMNAVWYGLVSDPNLTVPDLAVTGNRAFSKELIGDTVEAINAVLLYTLDVEVEDDGASEGGRLRINSSELFQGLRVQATTESRPVHTESETDNNLVFTVCACVRCAEFGLDCDCVCACVLLSTSVTAKQTSIARTSKSNSKVRLYNE